MHHLMTETETLPGMASPDEAAPVLVASILSAAANETGVHVFVTHDLLVMATASRLLGKPLSIDDCPLYLEGPFFWVSDGGVYTAYRDYAKLVTDLLAPARHRRVLGFDNLSHLPPALSDALCRVATGGGIRARKLYTDGEEFAVEAKRPVLFTAISLSGPERPALAERSIILDLPVLDPATRRSEAELDAAWCDAKPAVFGALLEGVAAAQRNYDLPVANLPRMADAYAWAVRAETGLGWAMGTVEAAFQHVTSRAVWQQVENDPVASLIHTVLNQHGGVWKVTTEEVAHQHRDYRGGQFNLGNAIQVCQHLPRIVPLLGQAGITAEKTHTRDGTRWVFRHVECPDKVPESETAFGNGPGWPPPPK